MLCAPSDFLCCIPCAECRLCCAATNVLRRSCSSALCTVSNLCSPSSPQAFDRAISTLTPVVILEQQFCESVLGLAAMPQSHTGSNARLGSSQHSITSHDRCKAHVPLCARRRPGMQAHHLFLLSLVLCSDSEKSKQASSMLNSDAASM